MEIGQEIACSDSKFNMAIVKENVNNLFTTMNHTQGCQNILCSPITYDLLEFWS